MYVWFKFLWNSFFFLGVQQHTVSVICFFLSVFFLRVWFFFLFFGSPKHPLSIRLLCSAIVFECDESVVDGGGGGPRKRFHDASTQTAAGLHERSRDASMRTAAAAITSASQPMCAARRKASSQPCVVRARGCSTLL